MASCPFEMQADRRQMAPNRPLTRPARQGSCREMKAALNQRAGGTTARGGRRGVAAHALATLEGYGWARRAPRPSLTEQGRAALAHDRSLRFELVANAMHAVLRDL
jgi:hypothetical protein